MKTIQKLKLLLFVLIITCFFGCEKIFFNASPESTPTAVFDEVWKGFNEKFALFEFKGVDWAAMKTKYRPLIADDMSDNDLALVLKAMISELREGHSGIVTKDPTGFSAQVERYRTGVDKSALFDKLLTINKYVGKLVLGSATISGKDIYFWDYLYLWDYEKDILPSYGTNYNDNILKAYDKQNNAKTSNVFIYYTKNNIGYIRIPSFSAPFDVYKLAEIVKEMSATKGLIIDVRPNSGGDPVGATQAAGIFIDKTYKTGIDRYKSGTGANDFVASDMFVSPVPELASYLKPVAVLTGGNVFSATTKFVFHLVEAPNVTLIGAKTGGGANAVFGFALPNGMVMKIATSEMIDIKGRHHDDGFSPKDDDGGIEKFYNTDGAGKDAVIDEAFKLLN